MRMSIAQKLALGTAVVVTLLDIHMPDMNGITATREIMRRWPVPIVIGICASTGGPPVLLEIFSSLEQPFPIPVLLVQHISRSFEESFARWLTQSTGHSVTIATTGQRLTPRIWIAPSGTHLTLGSSRLKLRLGGPGVIHCPSGNPLFESLARHCGPAATGILLTGMGNDGAEGLLALRQAGGTTIIQDQASSLIWGMPKAAGQLAAADYELNPAAIARAMMEMARRKAEILEGRQS